MQEEITSKTIAFSVRTAKMTASVLQKAISMYLRSQNQKKQTKTAKKAKEAKQGKVTVKELAKQDSGMTNIEITTKNIKSFERYARKYGVNYALKKDRSKEPPVYLVFFKARDKDAIIAAFREFSQREIRRAKTPSIHARLSHYRDVVAKLSKQKTKNKRQELER